MQSLVIHNVRPMGGEATSVTVSDGRIQSYGWHVQEGAELLDGGGAILIPGLVEAHTHMDKTLLGMGWYRNEVGPRLIDKIDNERMQRRVLGIDPARQSARQAVLAASLGTTHIRTHVDVDTEVGVAGIVGVLETRERYRDLVDIELVAFPQSGMLIRPGTVELMERALQLGAQVVGGLDPAGIDRDPKGHLDVVFGLAERYAVPVDIHLHEPAELGAFSMELIIERTKALGLQGKVTISHAFCLGMTDQDYVAALIDELAQAQIHILTTAPASRPAPAVKRLVEAGIVVAAGSDGVRDTWGPYNNPDMLERAVLVGLRNNLRRDDEVALALDTCTYGGARMMGLDDYGLKPGCRADLVLLDGETLAEAVVSRRPRKIVIKGGKVIARDGTASIPAP
ncbi:amidohydrolase family protein [Microvirga lotononidis]|uniref:Cytosine deaminase-like metal-dependent hydrolase n=1 Tax=Microvirga lotononidis TaxID=864069 RepID=I4YLL4_9HYPH|nr:amidohydrolase family protein [Microvirga lotononidis]EIM24856.1 cytosine deaminase-like metal-dependent hydrolase [Microvirga lotononidis]WQO29642.1 amidohydrolase family protein [Microvirga lotononidis]